MFVAELDRPWLDTPFLLQGLLVQQRKELETLRQYCRFVQVDPRRSADSVAAALRSVADTARDWDNGLHARLRGLVGRARLRRRLRMPRIPVLHGLFGRLRASDEGGPDPALGAATTVRPDARLGLPPGMRIQPYPPSQAIEAELPRARETWSRSAETLRRLMRDLREKGGTELRDIDQVAGELVESMVECPDAMLWVARLREQQQDTYQHCLKVALYLVTLGRQIGFPRDDLVRLGLIGMLADVGKVRLPRALLEKPGLLTPAEHAVVKTHVQLGLDALGKSMKLERQVELGILEHHERLDGSGYPRGLKNKEISIYGRMAAIADCYAALITERPYAEAMAPHDALMKLYEWAGSSFHEPLIEQFVQAIGIFPVGSMVELSSGEVAVVLEHNRVRRLEPRVLVVAGPDKQQLDEPFERNLLEHPVDDGERPIRIARGLAAGAYGIEPHDYYARPEPCGRERGAALE